MGTLLEATPLRMLHAYSHHMIFYLEAVGAVFEAYNGYCQVTRILCVSLYSSVLI